MLLLGLLASGCNYLAPSGHNKQQKDLLYAWVDKHIIRETPQLGAREVGLLRETEAVEDLHQATDELYRMTLAGYEFEGSFIKIRTQKGIEGWIHEKAVRKAPVPVRYRALIAFSTLEDVSANWQGFYHEIRNLYINTPVHVSYVVDGFDHVPVYNAQGEEVTYLDIRPWVETHKRGYICVQAGKDPYFVALNSPENMQLSIDAYFDRW